MELETSLDLQQLKYLKNELTRFMMSYKFALDELNTKIDILKQEFEYIHDYNPIEHVKHRIKTPESILQKVYRKGIELSIPAIKENIMDIAGIRITCSFISDIYQICDLLVQQKDVTLIEKKDYIKNPKPNGYQSLHLILQVPVFMSDRVDHVCVEVQIRTIAMDFWASLEHKIFYKYRHDVPQNLLDELKEAADSVTELDKKMEHLHREITKFKKTGETEEELRVIEINNQRFPIPLELRKLLLHQNE